MLPESFYEVFCMFKRVFFFAMIGACSVGLIAQSGAKQTTPQTAPDKTTLNLWPHQAPGTQPGQAFEVESSVSKEPLVAGETVLRVSNVSVPTMTLYAPTGKNTGTAVVVFPGGGWRILAMDLEGTEVCQWLNSIGVNCVLLKYRVPGSGPYPKSSAALQDAQRALSLVREHAAEWHIDPRRVGVLGFSAGGNLAAAVSTHFDQRLYDPVDDADKLSCRPDFAVLIYPGALHESGNLLALDPNVQPAANTPPTFLAQAENDPVHVENSVDYFLALKNMKVPAELHVYAQGGHGFGLRPTALPITTWPSSVQLWLHTINMLSSATP
jgi:acetyl esterase/lipase